jgi:iron(III) transport system permease protein
MTPSTAPAAGPAAGPHAGRAGAWRALGPGVWLAGALVLAFLLAFLVLPVARVFYTAFVESDGTPTLGHFAAFFSQGLMQEAFFNSLYVALMSACSPP